jgi:hypothetical protein
VRWWAAWSTTSTTRLERIATEQTRRSPVQLSLELFEDEAMAGPLWEELAPAERLAVVRALARLMTKSIEENGGNHDHAATS